MLEKINLPDIYKDIEYKKLLYDLSEIKNENAFVAGFM
jgi:hypothetical protein